MSGTCHSSQNRRTGFSLNTNPKGVRIPHVEKHAAWSTQGGAEQPVGELHYLQRLLARVSRAIDSKHFRVLEDYLAFGGAPCPLPCLLEIGTKLWPMFPAQSVDIPDILLRADLPRRTMAPVFCTYPHLVPKGGSTSRSLRGNHTYVLCSTQPIAKQHFPPGTADKFRSSQVCLQ